MQNNKVLSFVTQAERCLPDAILVRNEFDLIEIQILDNRLLNAGIYTGDLIIISTLEAVKNGDFIAIQLSETSFDIGIARFLGSGKLQVSYANPNFPPKVFKRDKIKLLGRAIRLERDLTEGK